MSYILLEYLCSVCGERLESLEDRTDPSPCIEHCEQMAPRVISAVSGRTKLGEVTQGKSDAPPPNVTDTRPLADGMPLREWKRERAKERRGKRIDYIRSKL